MSESKFLLKETSLLMVIYGVIASVISVVALVNADNNPNYWATGLVLLLIASVLELVFGALGFRKSDDAGRSGFFVFAGIVAAAVMLIILIMDFSVWSLLGLVLPVLYIIGGAMLSRRTE